MRWLDSHKRLFEKPATALLLVAPACSSTLFAKKIPTHSDAEPNASTMIELGQRPIELIEKMADGPLKDRLSSCKDLPQKRTRFSIAHRGAPLRYPEHTRESYLAAARMGAGLVECDVTFTNDGELVCRHSECDLHATTNILKTDLANRCSVPFSPSGRERNANARCCTTDLTLAEFKSLCGRMDRVNPDASSVDEYLKSPPGARSALDSRCGTLLSHDESIQLLDEIGVDFIPELKGTQTERAKDTYTRRDLALRMFEEYEAAGIKPERVFPQSFLLDDIRIWLAEKPRFARQAILLDGRFKDSGFNPNDPATFSPTMSELRDLGVRIIAPPIWGLLREEAGVLMPSAYATEARRSGLELIPWSLERPLEFSNDANRPSADFLRLIEGDENFYLLLHVLAQDVGALGVFSDWAASVSYYANCLRL